MLMSGHFLNLTPLARQMGWNFISQNRNILLDWKYLLINHCLQKYFSSKFFAWQINTDSVHLYSELRESMNEWGE